MNILLLGHTGLLGQALSAALSLQHRLYTPSHKECDVANIEMLRKTIEVLKPDMVINATGYTAVDLAEIESKAAFALNATAVGNLALILTPLDIPLLHFSTDYVFDGKKKTPYEETEPPHPIAVYGESKVDGEKEILTKMKKYYLVRTAWPFGPGKKNFVDTIIEQASQKSLLTVVDDQIGSPTYTIDLAHSISHLIEGMPYGIYHIVNSGQASWFELASETCRILGLPVEIKPISSQELGRPAKRPGYSVLANTRFPPLRSWKQALAAYLHDKTLIL